MSENENEGVTITEKRDSGQNEDCASNPGQRRIPPMKALLLEKYKKLKVAEAPEPVVGEDEALIRVQACGICGSDIHGYDGSSGRRVPPLIMGHEAAGSVERIGSAVEGIEPGARVTFNPMLSCGECDYCRRDETNLCNSRKVLGVSCEEFKRDGAFAEFVAVPARNLYTVPDDVSFDHAAMTEPTTVAVHAVRRTPIKGGEIAVVVGTGMIGLLTVQALKVAGCGKVVAIDLAEEKLQLARELGADVALNPKNDNVLDAVNDLTGGNGADIAMEVVGATTTVKTSVDVVRRGGYITFVGNLAPTVELPMQAVVTRELTIFGSCASNTEFPDSLNLLSEGRIKVEPFITARAALEETPGWFDRLYAAEPGLMKVIVKPSGLASSI